MAGRWVTFQNKSLLEHRCGGVATSLPTSANLLAVGVLVGAFPPTVLVWRIDMYGLTDVP